MTTRRDLAKQARAMLRSAGCDALNGAVKDGKYRRDRRAERKLAERRRRRRTKELGKLGPASPIRQIDATTRDTDT
jgi:hypothetical protein